MCIRDRQKGDGTPYKVFTPFYRRGCLAAAPPRAPLPAPQIGLATPPSATSVDDLDLLPAEDWGEMLAPHWQIGEAGAEARLQAFLDGGIDGYKEGQHLAFRQSPMSRACRRIFTGARSR